MMTRFVLLLAFSTGLCPAVDLAIGVGVHNNGVKVVGAGSADSTKATIINSGSNFLNIGVAALGWESPLIIGGPVRGLFSKGLAASEKVDFMFVPSLRLKVLPSGRFSPWVSAGLGAGRFSRTDFATPAAALARVSNTQWTVAVGAGVDVKLVGPLFARVEGRNFNYKSFDDLRLNNFQIFAGLGLRF